MITGDLGDVQRRFPQRLRSHSSAVTDRCFIVSGFFVVFGFFFAHFFIGYLTPPFSVLPSVASPPSHR